MLSFLSPLFLAGAAVAAVPIVLHLLKREPEPRVKFAAVKLLKNAPVELTEKRHLRELLLLALRVAALVLLAFAFARPFFASGAALGSTRTTIVAVDTSYSLAAPGRFERARQVARDAISRTPSGDLVGVVAFSDVADPVCRPTRDRALALAAIDSLSAGFGATRYRVGLDAAAAQLGSVTRGSRGTIVVVTDLQESGWDVGDHASVAESTRIEVVDVGEMPANLALTSVRLAGDRGDRVLATVRNTAVRAREAVVRLTLDDRAAGETKIVVPANGSAEASFTIGGRAATAKVAVDDPDGIQADNARYAVLDRQGRPSLLVVTATGDLPREAFYVQQALEASAADPARNGFDVAGVGGAQLSSPDGRWTLSRAAIIVLSTRGLERRGREALQEYVRTGGGAIIAAGPDIDGEVIADVLGPSSPLKIDTVAQAKPQERTLAPADVRHPLFQPFAGSAATIGLVKFQQVSRVGGRDCQPLARFTSGETAIVDCQAGEGRALVIASDLNNRWNDFPLHASFVPFVQEAVRYVSNARPRAAEYLVGDAPQGVPPKPGIVTLEEDLPSPSATASAGRRETAPTAHARRVAINVDPREVDPSRLTADEFQSAVTRLKDTTATEVRVEARQQEDRQHLWQYVLIGMLAVLAVEGWVASRTA
jgi:hypothetical protein